MEIFLIMVPLTIVLIGLSIWIFSWAVKSGQYDDLEGPAHSILFEDDKKMIPDNEKRPEEAAESEPTHKHQTEK